MQSELKVKQRFNKLFKYLLLLKEKNAPTDQIVRIGNRLEELRIILDYWGNGFIEL